MEMKESKLGIADVHDFIGSLKKKTQRSMIRVINGLVRKIKVLKAKEGEKNAKKHERLIEELQFLKKTHAKEASIFALKNTKSISEVAHTYKRALVRVASESLVAKEIASFRSKYPNWRNELPGILSSLGTKWKVNNKIKPQSKKSDKTIPTSSIVKESKKPKDQNDFKELPPKEKTSEKLPKDLFPSDKMDIPLPTDRKEGELVIKKINLDEPMTENESDDDSSPDNEPFFNTEKSSTVKDSFFLGGGDSDTEESEEESHEEEKKQRPLYRPGFDKNSDAKKQGYLNGEGHSYKKLHPSWEAKKQRNMMVKPSGKKTVFEEEENKSNKGLHPSWAAKKAANKSSIQEFKGRKTVFGEEEMSKSFYSSITQPSLTMNRETVKSDLHPSWAAKKEANKSSIQKFEGKKIVFDD